jgi:hypothetical protein
MTAKTSSISTDAARETKRLYNKAYREKNREKVLAGQRQWTANNTAYIRAYRLRHDYGITVERMNQLLQSQDSRCAICRAVFTGTPHVDHCHQSGVVRGLLCSKCNTGLGLFQDNETRLFNAIDYLRRHDKAGSTRALQN